MYFCGIIAIKSWLKWIPESMGGERNWRYGVEQIIFFQFFFTYMEKFGASWRKMCNQGTNLILGDVTECLHTNGGNSGEQ